MFDLSAKTSSFFFFSNENVSYIVPNKLQIIKWTILNSSNFFLFWTNQIRNKPPEVKFVMLPFWTLKACKLSITHRSISGIHHENAHTVLLDMFTETVCQQNISHVSTKLKLSLMYHFPFTTLTGFQVDASQSFTWIPTPLVDLVCLQFTGFVYFICNPW